ncbi:GPR endopeptidase [Roseburia sp. MSJ-14]|uniref:GPR endopeptidase n=1 Tax=Roseburia sp. MSJ-14 TaxID=2841514 RepID=UPI001C124F55|nr:GPR endopeptidase [Roseburia sp. MSJ-14]MBU5472520.1 GPR endopeptidase [Roseburia sp. MSJ-14]
MEQLQVRTDLALETREKFEEDNVEIKGVKVDEKYLEETEIKVTTMVIETENGAKAMGRPKGNYITVEASDMDGQDEEYHQRISMELARIIKNLLPKTEEKLSVLIVGLGNREVTPDALGPRVVDQMMITRHVLKEFGKYAFGEEEVTSVSGIVPGVMAQTGMESQEIIRGVIEETAPDVLIAIDALAARSTKRLSRTIQITDTGINPGSGVGNHRHGLSKETVGIPVIAIGVPTVVDAATIVSDTMQNLIQAMEESAHLQSLSTGLNALNAMEKYELIRELLSPQLNTMFVTPKDIDESVRKLSDTISEGLNIALA